MIQPSQHEMIFERRIMKTRKLYSVRYFGYKGSIHSKTVGFKGRLMERAKALRIVRRLKAAGVDATAAALTVAA